MHPDLVGSAGHGTGLHQTFSIGSRHDSEDGASRLATLDNPVTSGTYLANGRIGFPFRQIRYPIDQRQIPFFNQTVMKATR